LYDFDELGISFQLKYTDYTGTDLSVATNDLVITVADDFSEARFQLGSSTRDTMDIVGFKDIRINGYNQNSSVATSTGIKEDDVFDDIYTTLDTIDGNSVSVLTSTNFATLANRIETAIITIGDFRGYLGAQQNRLEYAIGNIKAQSENLSAANSRIRDTDFAAETANLTRTQILQQAATAMLAQANQMPNVILALLK
jgi:flagellin